MYPQPLKFIGIEFIRSYGVMLALGFLIGILWARKRAVKASIPSEHVIDLSFIVLIASVIGSRFFYVVYHLDEFSNNLLNMVNPFQAGTVGIAGLSMMGGIILALASAVIFLIVKKINPWPLFDAMMPMFALGLGITRVGCFLNGCCYGLPAHDHFGLVFPMESPAGFHYPGIPIIPTQLYSSIAGFIILAVVLISERYKRFDGHSFWLTIGLYSIWRFIIDFFRYYEGSMIFATIGDQAFSKNQFLTVLLFLLSVIAYIIMYLRNKKKTARNDKGNT
ncbi:MAG: prolipoprotein diacylglyceryl transferase [Candidatus Zixiibacteriota bacterium]|nr:MAG: prolipoprotein diacylglyceryl transferase [candidate division Zixibacteria bacterium]